MTIGLLSGLRTIGAFLNIEGLGRNIRDKDAKLLTSNGSITSLLDELIVEPTFVVTNAVSDSESYASLMQVNLNLFASLYSNAYLSLVELRDIKAKHALSVLQSGRSVSPKNKWISKIGNNSDVFEESMGDIVNSLFSKGTINENSVLENIKVVKGEGDIRTGNEASVSNRSGKADKEPEILNKHLVLTASVVDKNDDGKTKKYKEIKVPIMIRAAVYVVSTQEMIDYCTLTNDQFSLGNRIHKYRAGGISAKEFWLCSDIIKDYGRKLGRQGSSKILEVLEQRKDNSLANNSETPVGLGRDYGSIFIHSTEKKDLDLAIRGTIDDEYTKDKLLHNIASFNLNVVNDAWERVSIYTSGFRGVVSIEFGKLKAKDDSDKMKTMFETLIKGNSSR